LHQLFAHLLWCMVNIDLLVQYHLRQLVVFAIPLI